MFREFLERNVKDFNYRAFLIIKLQLLLFAMLIFIFAKPLMEFTLFVFGEVILAALYLYAIIIEFKSVEKAEYPKYLLFFSAILLFIQLSWIVPAFIGANILTNYYFISFLLVALLLFSFLFKIFFGRNYTLGRVLLSNEKSAVVETEFDLLSFTNGGKFIVENNKKRREGEQVKVAVKNLFFYRKPYKIL